MAAAHAQPPSTSADIPSVAHTTAMSRDNGAPDLRAEAHLPVTPPARPLGPVGAAASTATPAREPPHPGQQFDKTARHCRRAVAPGSRNEPVQLRHHERRLQRHSGTRPDQRYRVHPPISQHINETGIRSLATPRHPTSPPPGS